MYWLDHGFRGNIQLARQLLAKGMYISFWYSFILRSESSALLKDLPADRIFFETDGAEADISKIYDKVATDLDMTDSVLRATSMSNYMKFFSLK